MTQAESPECTPASSTCSMTPPMMVSPVWCRESRRRRLQPHLPRTGRATRDARRTDHPRALGSRRQPTLRERRFSWSSSYTMDMALTAQHVGRPNECRDSRCAPMTSSALIDDPMAVPPGGWGISSWAHTAFQRSRSSARSMRIGAGTGDELLAAATLRASVASGHQGSR